MTILQKLKEISLCRNKRHQQEKEKQNCEDATFAEVDGAERVFDIPKKSRPPSIFIQLGSNDVIPTAQKEEEKPAKKEESEKKKAAKVEIETSRKDNNYETLIMRAWEESVDDTQLETVFYEHENDSEDSFSDNDHERTLAMRRVAVRQSRILSILSYQARDISKAKEEHRPISLVLTPTKSAMKRGSAEVKAKERRSLTIIDPRDPMNPHPVICRKEFLEELRTQDRLSFNSSDFKQQHPTPKTETKSDDDEDDPQQKEN